MNIVKLQRHNNHKTIQARIIIPVTVHEQVLDVKELIVSYNKKRDMIECKPVR